MKKLQLSVLLILLSVAAQAQFYNFSYRTEAYQEFTDGNAVLTDFDLSAEYYDFTSFKLFDFPTNTQWTVSKNGYMVSTTNDNSFALDPMIGAYIKRDDNTSVTEKTEMVDGKMVQKVQWKNMGLDGHDAEDFVNFQVWVYLESQMVEFHYGPRQVTSDAAFDGESGPQILVAQLTSDFQNVKEIYAVKGSAGNPEALYNGFDYYTGMPDENLVMRFYNPTLSSVKSLVNLNLNIYPNPANNVVNIDGDFTGSETLIIRSITGSEVLIIDEIGDLRTFNTANLKQGVYYIEVIGDTRRYTAKLVK